MAARRKKAPSKQRKNAPSRPQVSSQALPVPGFRYAGVHSGIKQRGLDLALIVSDVPASLAGVFTQSTIVGAPVTWSRKRVAAGRARAVVANSGCANTAMGARGKRDAESMAAHTGRALGCSPNLVCVASTGVIGDPLPMSKIRSGISKAASRLVSTGLPRAAEAIRTTDTFAKFASVRTRVERKTVILAGIAKGSGMIEPKMATMLSFLTTDASATPGYLRGALKRVVDQTYNRVTIDGEGSTSDTVLLMANGLAGNPTLRSAKSPGAARFEAALLEVAEELSLALARDGEGATKLVTVKVSGAANPKEADHAARRIANSLLVKTAIFGRDPNWGRILQTIGAGQIRLKLPRVEVKLCGVAVFRAGAPTGPGARKRAEAGLAADEIEIEVHLGAGRSRAQIWTCDLSYDYVRINAEYTS